MEPPPPTAAILLIGDELLTGKIRDENGHFLARMLRRRGVKLVEIAVVGDVLDEIGDAVLRLSARAPVVFTSGGVGPTHDDRTLEAIAKATGRPLRRNAQMEAQLRTYYKDRITDAALAMADLPAGTQLRAMPGWPVLRLDLEAPGREPSRLYILPGVPGLMRAKLEALEALDDELPLGQPWHLSVLHTRVDESKLAPQLQRIVEAFPDVEIGSYPRWSRDADGSIRGHVRVTFEAPQNRADRVDAARQALADALGADALIGPGAEL